jgi:hypothetical protein
LQKGAVDFRDKDDNKTIEDYLLGIKKNIFINQALKESDVPTRLLDEEVKWLNTLGINVKGYKVELEHFYDLFNNFFIIHSSTNTAKKFKKKFANDKSLKSIERDLSTFLKNCLGVETEKQLANKLIENLKISISIMKENFPQNDTLSKLEEKIAKIEFI